MFNEHPEFFKDPHIDYSINDFNLNFEDYIAKNKKIIEKHCMTPAWNFELNAPYELKPTHPRPDRGALLVHGLLDTPFIMHDLGKILQSCGLLVRSVLLPGHGTVPGALLNIKYQDWIKTVTYGMVSLKKECEKIFLVGFSTGALLSVYETVENPNKIAGVILLAPAFKINTKLDFATNWHRYISWYFPRTCWANIGIENDYTKYQSLALNAVYQVYQLANLIKRNRPIACPIFLVATEDDPIVSTHASLRYFQKTINPNNRFLLYSGNHPHYEDKRIIIRNSSYQELHIQNFSHVSLPISPNNFHYGRKGDYPLASHVDDDQEHLYCAMSTPEKLIYNLLYDRKILKLKHQRLSFNPDFDFLAEEMKRFIEKVGFSEDLSG